MNAATLLKDPALFKGACCLGNMLISFLSPLAPFASRGRVTTWGHSSQPRSQGPSSVSDPKPRNCWGKMGEGTEAAPTSSHGPCPERGGLPQGRALVLSRGDLGTPGPFLLPNGSLSPRQLRNKGLMLGRWALGLTPCESSVFPESFPHRQVCISTQEP